MTIPTFTLAYSPCPNDTFLFYHLVHSQLSNEFGIQEELKDVEELNQSAVLGKYDITKLSFAKYFQVSDQYEILDVGSALGRNCGPLLIHSAEKNPPGLEENLSSQAGNRIPKILSPGENTTANLLLRLYLKSKNFSQSYPIEYHRYDRIIPKLKEGVGDYGLIIHEERFTYLAQNMKKFIDLGEWWEETTHSPIPLGCIAIKKSLSNPWKEKVSQALRESLDRAWENPEIPQHYILENSQNKDLDVVQSHIKLYVNEFTRDLGVEGKRSIQELMDRMQGL